MQPALSRIGVSGSCVSRLVHAGGADYRRSGSETYLCLAKGWVITCPLTLDFLSFHFKCGSRLGVKGRDVKSEENERRNNRMNELA